MGRKMLCNFNDKPQTLLEGSNGNFTCDTDNYQDEAPVLSEVVFLCDIHKLMRQWDSRLLSSTSYPIGRRCKLFEKPGN